VKLVDHESHMLSLDDFDASVNTFDFPSINGVTAVIGNTVTMAFKHYGKSV
jgi:hypothetical protein